MAPGRRARTLELGCEIERRGFPAIWCPGGGNAIAACQAILAATNEIVVGIGIQSIYARDAADLGAQAAFLHEVYGGRFRLGLGVAHRARSPLVGTNARSDSPLTDMRTYVQALRDTEKASGPLPPIVLAALRDKMVDLALDVADGAVWANGSRSDMGRAVNRIPAARRTEGFTVANMITAVIDDDLKAALAVTRRTMSSNIVSLPRAATSDKP